MKRFFIVLSLAVLVFCCAVGGFEIVRDNGFQKECVADYPQKQTKQCPRCVGTGRCSVCQGRGYFFLWNKCVYGFISTRSQIFRRKPNLARNAWQRSLCECWKYGWFLFAAVAVLWLKSVRIWFCEKIWIVLPNWEMALGNQLAICSLISMK